jgi:hypothetical protein
MPASGIYLPLSEDDRRLTLVFAALGYSSLEAPGVLGIAVKSLTSRYHTLIVQNQVPGIALLVVRRISSGGLQILPVQCDKTLPAIMEARVGKFTGAVQALQEEGLDNIQHAYLAAAIQGPRQLQAAEAQWKRAVLPPHVRRLNDLAGLKISDVKCKTMFVAAASAAAGFALIQ